MMMARGMQSLPALIATLSLQSACGEAVLTREALEKAESHWASEPVASYAIVVSVSAAEKTLRTVKLEVREGELVEAVITVNGVDRPIDRDVARPYTVEGLFQTLDEELAAGKRRYVRASFDSSRGFPDRIELGPLRNAPEATRWILRVESFSTASAVGDSAVRRVPSKGISVLASFGLRYRF